MTSSGWQSDASGLPCFDLVPGVAPDVRRFRHLLGTGRLSAIADGWGNVNLFTTEGGFQWFNAPDSTDTRSSIYLMMVCAGELVSLLHSELSRPGRIRIGTGYIEYQGEVEVGGDTWSVSQRVFAPPDRGRRLVAEFSLHFGGPLPRAVTLQCRSDVTRVRDAGGHRGAPPAQHQLSPGAACFTPVGENLGSITLRADEAWEPSVCGVSLRLERTFTLKPQQRVAICCEVGYGEGPWPVAPRFDEALQLWRERLKPFAIRAAEPWIARECLWAAGQLLSFTSYDRSTGEFYVALGGYGWPGFSVREVSETSLVLAECDPALTLASLRFVACTQLASGDVPKWHNFRRDRTSHECDSDNELWFVLGCMESVRLSGRREWLDEVCAFWDEGAGSLWEHCRRAFVWVRDAIGLGPHGLILIRDGDWNDYLSLMGAQGRGESVMNSGMACRAFSAMARVARERGETAFAAELEQYTAGLRAAVASAFDGQWFVRGYTDAGKAVGSSVENRLFINAQTWAVLGGCATPAQARSALTNMVRENHSDIGLLLMSRPYSSPAPDDISWCAIPAGDGENAGIWPQTVHWAVWALAEAGMCAEARAEWECGTLHAHARRFPNVPFGVFNGPDSYSSRWAGPREGWTQEQLIDRARFAPMNPPVAWQGFSWRRLAEASAYRGPQQPFAGTGASRVLGQTSL